MEKTPLSRNHRPSHLLEANKMVMYPQRSYNQVPYSLINTGQPIYSYNWNNYNNAPPGSAKGYYQPHQLSSYPTINTTQIPPHNIAAQQQTKKRLPVIDPRTGKNMLEGVNDETPAPKDEKAPESVMFQFATRFDGYKIYEDKVHDSHANECLYRPMQCPNCVEKVRFRDYKSHICKTRHSCQQTYETPMMPAGSANLEAENDSESYANQFVPKSNVAVEGGSGTERKDSVHQQYVNEKEKLDHQFSSVYSNPEGLSALLQNFENMLLKGEDHDVILKVREKAFKAHRNVLRARSPVFAAMFSHDMKENSDGAILIDDCEPDAFGDFLRYVYTARTTDLTPAKGVALYYAADKYDVPGLKETCAEFLKTSLTTTSVCDVVALAVKHGDSDLLERAATFFARHMEEVMVTLEWQRFITSNPIQASELCLKSVKAGYRKIDG